MACTSCGGGSKFGQQRQPIANAPQLSNPVPLQGGAPVVAQPAPGGVPLSGLKPPSPAVGGAIVR